MNSAVIEIDSVGLEAEVLDAGIDALLQAVCVHRRSAMVRCEDPALMEVIGLRLARALRGAEGIRMEVVQITGIDSLLTRFNGLMSDMALSGASRPPGPRQEIRLWVLHLTRKPQMDEIALLMRLVRGFPGVGVRLLMLCSQDAAAEHALGGHGETALHRWSLPARGGRRAEDAVVSSSRRAFERGALAPVGLTQRAQAALRSVVRRGSLRPPAWWTRACAPVVRRVLRHRAISMAVHALAWPVRRGLGFAGRRIGPPVRRWIKARLGHLQARQRQRLALIAGGFALFLSGAAAAWWQTAWPGRGVEHSHPGRKPVPEIVERIDDLRPQATQAMIPS